VLALFALGGILGFALAPDTNDRHPPAELSDFFSSCAQVMAGLVVALALFQSGPSPAAGHGARRFLSLAVFPLLGLGLFAALAGLSQSLPHCLYRVLFAVVVGTGTAAAVSTLLVGAGNLHAQRQQALEEQADELDPG
jgi:hypothetical protein